VFHEREDGSSFDSLGVMIVQGAAITHDGMVYTAKHVPAHASIFATVEASAEPQ
jgi:hypothetical protein